MKHITILSPAVCRSLVVICTAIFLFGTTHARETSPAALVKLAKGANAILVEKSSQRLFLYVSDQDKPRVAFEMPCSTGAMAGPKIQSGDRKTPVGVYFITDAYEDRYLSPVYGKKAFPIDYPNLLDRQAGRNGSAIWLHGTNKPLKPMDSNGCVALDNENILSLSSKITLNLTPVIVTETIRLADPVKINQERAQILALIDRWAQSQISGTYHKYLAAYDPSYLPPIQWWPDWITDRGKLRQSSGQSVIRTSNIGIYRHDQVWVALFDYALTVGDQILDLGKKKLYCTQSSSGRFTIIGEAFQVYPKALGKQQHPLLAAAASIVTESQTDAFFIKRVQAWLDAWSSKRMDEYAAFYTDDFTSDGMNKSQWVRRKKRIARQYDYIRITARDFDVRQKDRTCVVRFYQVYESSGFHTQGTKTLVLQKKGGSWKIFQENWKEN